MITQTIKLGTKKGEHSSLKGGVMVFVKKAETFLEQKHKFFIDIALPFAVFARELLKNGTRIQLRVLECFLLNLCAFSFLFY